MPEAAQLRSRDDPKSDPKRMKMEENVGSRKCDPPRPSWLGLGSMLEDFRTRLRTQKGVLVVVNIMFRDDSRFWCSCGLEMHFGPNLAELRRQNDPK